MSGRAQELLQNCAVSKRRLSVQLGLLEDLRALAKRASGTLPEISAALEERMKPLEAKLTEDISELLAEIGLAEDLVRHIGNPLLKEVLERRYMQQADFKEIAAAMHYSERHVRRLHGKALQQLPELFPEVKI